MFCSVGIHGCFGFVLARDFVSNKHPVRETCGKCALKLDAGMLALPSLDEKGVVYIPDSYLVEQESVGPKPLT